MTVSKISKDELIELLKTHAQSDIDKLKGFTKGYTCYLCKRHGIEVKKLRKLRHADSLRPERDFLAALLRKNYTLQVIGDSFGVSRERVRQWAEEMDIDYKSKRKLPNGEYEHGTMRGFTYGCRCFLCKKARSIANKRRYQAKKLRLAEERNVLTSE